MDSAIKGTVIDLDADVALGLQKSGYVEALEEAPDESGGYEMRHMGRSKYAVFHAGVRLTQEPIDKDAARAFLEAHRSKQ